MRPAIAGMLFGCGWYALASLAQLAREERLPSGVTVVLPPDALTAIAIVLWMVSMVMFFLDGLPQLIHQLLRDLFGEDDDDTW